ncbi:MAG TPA: J domain-containing protein [Planctomycetaceae bacterium]|nr:J domain-containing protein [Planctomycetaceae bacterium]
MSSDDYYQTLGVSRSATQAEIRKAYKKLARQYHPDVKPDDAEAAEKFKQIQEAYDVLGDKEKRDKYDQFGTAWKHAGAGAHHWAGDSGSGPIDMSDLFGGGFNFQDLFSGGRARSQARPRPSKGSDVTLEIQVSFHTATLGGKHDLQFRVDGRLENITVTIPAGIPDGKLIRLAGQGAKGLNGGPNGDLLVTVHVAPHPFFKREGNNLFFDLPLTPSEAALGTKIDVPTLDEGPVTLSVPPGTSSGMKLRLKGKGVISPQTKQRGDQFATVKIVVPPALTEESRKLYEQLAQTENHNPRANLWF